MNNIINVESKSFQDAWAKAVTKLHESNWESWNLVVQIKQPDFINNDKHAIMEEFAKNNLPHSQSQIACTIFPYKIWNNPRVKDRETLYNYFWKFYNRTKAKRKAKWEGTYFGRMICYNNQETKVDQLGSIIDHINTWSISRKAAHAIVIPCPNHELNLNMGGPCLNYLTVQVDKHNHERTINLLAVYRNHYFCERAYGNYFGLCELLKYISEETNSKVGFVTCISSHAEIEGHRIELLNIAEGFIENENI